MSFVIVEKTTGWFYSRKGLASNSKHAYATHLGPKIEGAVVYMNVKTAKTVIRRILECDEWYRERETRPQFEYEVRHLEMKLGSKV